MKFGTAAVPSTSIRPPDSLEATKRSKLNTTKTCKIKTKKKNKLSMVVDQEGNKIDLGIEEYKNLMNSNRLIEPFSPTFEHPEDFLPSNQTSYRPGNLVVSKHVSKTDDLHSEDMPVNRIIQHAILKESNLISKRDIKIMKSNHNRTYSSHTETIDIDRPKGSNQSDIFKETGKFINPLNESADITLNHSAATRRLDMKNRTTRYKKRPKTGNGRHSRRSKPKNKSEDRKDKKRIFSKSVDQSYHDKPTINQHNVSKVTGFSPDPVQDFLHKVNDEDFLSGTEGKSLVSPSHKINKLIKESLKRNKEHETLKIIEQILKEEDNLLKKEKLEKLNNDVRKTNRMKEEMRKKKH